MNYDPHRIRREIESIEKIIYADNGSTTHQDCDLRVKLMILECLNEIASKN